jgi:hypothetical protein
LEHFLEERRHIVSRLCGSDNYLEFYLFGMCDPEEPGLHEGVVTDDVAQELLKLGRNAKADERPDLEADLRRSDRIKSLVRDRAVAERLYRGLCYVVWLNDGRPWSCSPLSAGPIVCELRSSGESLADFDDIGNEGEISDDVRTELAALGWLPKAPSS